MISNMLYKIKYWLKGFDKTVQKQRKCKKCCVFCAYLDLCMADLDLP